jgi:undecaprenyl-diphosphatase
MLDLFAPIWGFFARHAYVVAFVVTAIDATGLPFPGRVLLVAAGTMAAAGEVHVVAMILIAAAGAVVGDHVWYVIARWRGDAMVEFACKVTMRSRGCADRASDLLQKYGPFAIVIGRFLAAVRVFVTAGAMASGMSYTTYLLSEIGGALLWASIFVLLGYGAGGWLRGLVDPQGGATIVAIALIVTAVLASAIVYRRMRRAAT